jgi:hypothetical protein
MDGKKFYTYMYLRQRDGAPYYIGKGCGDRAYSNNRAIPRPDADARIYVQYWADEAEAFEMEKYYIRLFGRKDNCTGILRNLTDGGEGAAGFVQREESCRKMSEAKKANPANAEHCRILAAAQRGKPLSEEHRLKLKASPAGIEHRRKLREANRGRRLSKEHCRKISEANKGKPRSEEYRRNISAAHIGKPLTQAHRMRLREGHKHRLPATQETRNKMSTANVGRIHTPEARKNMSEAAKGRCERQRLLRDQFAPTQLVLFHDLHLSYGKNIQGVVAAQTAAA